MLAQAGSMPLAISPMTVPRSALPELPMSPPRPPTKSATMFRSVNGAPTRVSMKDEPVPVDPLVISAERGRVSLRIEPVRSVGTP